MAWTKKFLAVATACLLLVLPAVGAGGGECLVTGTPYGVGAAAAVVMEAETGTVLFSQNSQKRLPMASTTKILTALLALEEGNIDIPFLVDSDAIQVEGSSMGLVKGDTVTLRALAGGMLTASGNDAANAAAVHIAGSIPEFAVLMNKRAADIGMKNSSFVTPSGLDAEEHYSTAYDMALLAAEALRNPTFLEMCSAKRLSLHFGNPAYDRSLYNHNRLLNIYPPAIGIKTGFTRESGRCLVSAARKEDVTLITVTLNCGDDWNVHQTLYERYFPMVSRQEIPAPTNLRLPVTGGTSSAVLAVPERKFSTVLIGGRGKDSKSEVFAPYFAYAPIKKGDILGKIVYYIDNEILGECNLMAAEDIPIQPPRDTKKSKENTIWHRNSESKRRWETAASFPDVKPKNISRPAG
ncbi:MAG: D-alanyl-D-alanine carboxypeptidase family protein [Angelakisella sp.]